MLYFGFDCLPGGTPKAGRVGPDLAAATFARNTAGETET